MKLLPVNYLPTCLFLLGVLSAGCGGESSGEGPTGTDTTDTSSGDTDVDTDTHTVLEGVTYQIEDGFIVIRSGDNEVSFGSDDDPRPYAFFRGENGLALDPVYSRNPSSLDQIAGEVSSEHTGPGQLQAVRIDHGNSENALLGRITFASGLDRLYIMRRCYSDFDMMTDGSYRFFFDSNTIVLSNGMFLKGQTSGATAKILKVQSSSELWLDYDYGTILEAIPTNFVVETVNIYPTETDLNGDTNIQGTLNSTVDDTPIMSFNNKILRLWHHTGGPPNNNNVYIGQGPNTKSGAAIRFSEYTGESADYVPFALWTVFHLDHYHWNIDEFFHKSGSIDVEDAELWWWYNGALFFRNIPYIARTSVNYEKYQQVYQQQVSNGAKPGSYRYIDYLYVSEKVFRVMLANTDTLNLENDSETKYEIITLPILVRANNEIKTPDFRDHLPEATHIIVVGDNNEHIVSIGL